jgi:hypothetical protein
MVNEAPESALSQREWILRQLKAGRFLTFMDCLREYGIGRTAARVGELRDQGHNIITHKVDIEKANGRKARVGVYRLHQGAA